MRWPTRYLKNCSPSFCRRTQTFPLLALLFGIVSLLANAEAACVPLRPRSFFELDRGGRSSFSVHSASPAQPPFPTLRRQSAPPFSALRRDSTSRQQDALSAPATFPRVQKAFIYLRWGLGNTLQHRKASAPRNVSGGLAHSGSIRRSSCRPSSLPGDHGRGLLSTRCRAEAHPLASGSGLRGATAGVVSCGGCLLRSSPTDCFHLWPGTALDCRPSLLHRQRLSDVTAETACSLGGRLRSFFSPDRHRASSLVGQLLKTSRPSARAACSGRAGVSSHSRLHFPQHRSQYLASTVRRCADRGPLPASTSSQPGDVLQDKEFAEAVEDTQRAQQSPCRHPSENGGALRNERSTVKDGWLPMPCTVPPHDNEAAVEAGQHKDAGVPSILELRSWLEAWLRRAVMIALQGEPLRPDVSITVTESISSARTLFDFQSSIAIALAGRVGSEQGPEEIAEGLLKNLERSKETNRVVALTAVSERGFLNFRLTDHYVALQLAAMLRECTHGGNRLGIPRTKSPRKIVVDYASPNICKDLHVGHLRSAVVGDVIANLLEFEGHHVWRQNHLGDFGWPVALVLGALEDPELRRLPEVQQLKQAVRGEETDSPVDPHEEVDFSKTGRLDKEPHPAAVEPGLERGFASQSLSTCISDCEGQRDLNRAEGLFFHFSWSDIYTAAHRKAETDADFKVRCEAILQELQTGSDLRLGAIWKKLRRLSVQTFLTIYRMLRLRAQEIRGESFYASFFPEVLARLRRRGLITRSADAVMCTAVADVESPGGRKPVELSGEEPRAEGERDAGWDRQDQGGRKNVEGFLLQKRGGTLTYAATDLAAALHRSEVLKADQILYVVDNAQAHHFRRLFSAARQASIASDRSASWARDLRGGEGGAKTVRSREELEQRERDDEETRCKDSSESGQTLDQHHGGKRTTRPDKEVEDPGREAGRELNSEEGTARRSGAHEDCQERKEGSSGGVSGEEAYKYVRNRHPTEGRYVDLRHVGVGLVKDRSGGKMTSRGGGAPRLKDLLTHAVRKAEDKLLERDSEQESESTSASDRRRLATILGINAVKYAELSTRRDVDYSFSLDKILNIKGNTAPYILYSLVRAKGILLRAADFQLPSELPGEGREDTEDVLCFDRSVLDRQLAVRLVMFPVAVNDATATFLPSKLTAYLFSLCLAFNAFYEQCEVVNAADESVRFSRHLLVRAFARVLEKGLELLGIDTLDKM